MQRFIAEYWGQILALGIPAFLVGRWIIRDRREMKELEARSRCGPGCICGGENVRQQTPATIYVQAPPPMIYQQPQVIYLQAPAPQVIYQQAPPARYLPTQQPAGYLPEHLPIYAHHPQPQRVMSYYPGHSPEPTDYPQEIYYLPPAEDGRQVAPPRASAIDEARRRFEEEFKEMKRRR